MSGMSGDHRKHKQTFFKIIFILNSQQQKLSTQKKPQHQKLYNLNRTQAPNGVNLEPTSAPEAVYPMKMEVFK
jgi:hypothetical protein